MNNDPLLMPRTDLNPLPHQNSLKPNEQFSVTVDKSVVGDWDQWLLKKWGKLCGKKSDL